MFSTLCLIINRRSFRFRFSRRVSFSEFATVRRALITLFGWYHSIVTRAPIWTDLCEYTITIASSARTFAFGYGNGGGVGSHRSKGGRRRRRCRRHVTLGTTTEQWPAQNVVVCLPKVRKSRRWRRAYGRRVPLPSGSSPVGPPPTKPTKHSFLRSKNSAEPLEIMTCVSIVRPRGTTQDNGP